MRRKCYGLPVRLPYIVITCARMVGIKRFCYYPLCRICVPSDIVSVHDRKLNKCPNNSITSIAIFHTSSVGLRYSLVFTCFSFFLSIELVTKRNRYICVSICLMFQMIDIGSLMPISRPGLFTF